MDNLNLESELHLSQKAEAKRFLDDLEAFLREKVRPRTEIRQKIEDTVQRTKLGTEERHLTFREGAFLNIYAVPLLNEYLASRLGSNEQARLALLSESYRHHPAETSGSPASKERHPFTKAIGKGLEPLIRRWWNPAQYSVVSQSCPDLAFRRPCPHTVVFEGKYFREGTLKKAQSALVANIYQCFFYLGLPRVPACRTHAGWQYDYACLLAYDASEEGNLSTAWQQIKDSEIGRGLWNGANIHVMLLGGPD